MRAPVVIALLGTALLPTPAQALTPPSIPLAVCSDLRLTFSEVTQTSYVVTATATVLVSGVFGWDAGHGYLGSSTTPDAPDGEVRTSRMHVSGRTPGTTYTHRASCPPAAASATVRTLPALVCPRVGTSTVAQLSHLRAELAAGATRSHVDQARAFARRHRGCAATREIELAAQAAGGPVRSRLTALAEGLRTSAATGS